MTSLPHWQKLLSDRGILKAALEAGWQQDGEFWCYPLYNLDGTESGQYRYKAMDSTSKTKYRWSESNGEPRPSYYLLPGLVESIQAANGRLILSSGEPDTLAFRAAQAQNVSNFFGENNIPETLEWDLQTLGVKSIELYPDLDKAGFKWAADIKAACPNLDVHVYKLPGEFGSKYDINKLWIETGFNYNRFWITLDDCLKLDVSEYATPQLPRQQELSYEKSNGSLPPELITEIERKLGVVKYKKNGYSEPVRCPFHDDTNPSAGWHVSKHILKCMVCHGQNEYALAIEVAEALGISYRQNLPPSGAKARVLKDAPKRSNSPRKEIYSFAEAGDLAQKALTDPGASQAALPMKWANISQFGGMARLIQPRKMVAIVGDTGDGKTAFMETLVDFWLSLGFSGIVESKEWSTSEHVYRAVQRHGGATLSEIVAHLTYKDLAERGVAHDKNYGTDMGEFKYKQWESIKNKLVRRPGKLYYVDRVGNDVLGLTKKIEDQISVCKAQGETISFIGVDYLQLLAAEGSNEYSRTSMALNILKDMTGTYDLVTLIGSQIVKEAGKSASFGGKNTLHVMQNARADVFNLVILLARALDEHGKKSLFADTRLLKNSLGDTGDTKLELDPTRMIWKDCIVSTRNVNDPAPIHIPEQQTF